MANSSPPSRATVSPRRTDALQALRGGAEHVVADRVAKAVVHRLEVVEIQIDDRNRRVIAAGQSMVDPVAEQRTVGKPRERVVEGLVCELLLELLLVGDIDHEAPAVDRGARSIPHDDRLVEEPLPAAVLRAKAVLHARWSTRLDVDPILGSRTGAIIRVHELEPEILVGLPLLGAVADELLELGADVDRRGVLLEPVDIRDQGHRLDQLLIFLANRVGSRPCLDAVARHEENPLERGPGGRRRRVVGPFRRRPRSCNRAAHEVAEHGYADERSTAARGAESRSSGRDRDRRVSRVSLDRVVPLSRD